VSVKDVHDEMRMPLGIRARQRVGKNWAERDSLLKESQRRSPVFLLTFNRILPGALTLLNGVHLQL
jgi:hypothetical protein